MNIIIFIMSGLQGILPVQDSGTETDGSYFPFGKNIILFWHLICLIWKINSNIYCRL